MHDSAAQSNQTSGCLRALWRPDVSLELLGKYSRLFLEPIQQHLYEVIHSTWCDKADS